MEVKRRFLILFVLLVSVSLAASDLSAADLLDLGRADEAISTLQSKISSAPNDAQAYNLLCRSYFEERSWDRGISACEKAVSLEPDNSLYHLWLGRIYGEKADSANFFSAASLAGKVHREFEKAVELDPNNVAARTDLAEFYLEAPGIVGGGRDKAEAQAHALASLDPAKSHWVLARIAEKEKDFAMAEKEYRAAIEASHHGAHDVFNLALFYFHQHDFDRMEPILNQAVAARMDRPEVVMESAELLIRSGRNFPLAAQWLRRYLAGPMVEEGPAFKAHYLLGTALEKRGDQKAAAEEYRNAISLAKNYSPAQEALSRIER
jgi:tetratricopeptide (TPR) repeat protein